MPLLFPIAADARSALDASGGARTAGEAAELAGAPVTLVSEWLRPTPGEQQELQKRAEAGVAQGFVQLYEDAKGRPVLAVTFWKRKIAKSEPPAKPRAPAEDHTDDLYFAKPSSRTKRTRRTSDPNQLDLFRRDPETPPDPVESS